MELLSKFCIKGMWIVKLFVAWTVAFNLFEALGLFLLLKTTLISQVLSGAKVHCYLLPCFSILVEIIVSYSLILRVLSGTCGEKALYRSNNSMRGSLVGFFISYKKQWKRRTISVLFRQEEKAKHRRMCISVHHQQKKPKSLLSSPPAFAAMGFKPLQKSRWIWVKEVVFLSFH